MRILTVFGVVCIALAMAGCSSDQPLDSSTVGGGAGNTIIQITASATVPQFRVWDWTEDTNGNGRLDTERDLDNDGRLDSGEDTNHNGTLDAGEDRNANGRLNFDEDFNSNGLLDRRTGDTGVGSCPECEDANVNCILDPGEDKNGDGILWSEDVDCDNRLDGINEDTNRNGVRDLEDTIIPNSAIDAGVWCEGVAVDPTTGLLDPGAFISGLVPVPLGGEVLLYHQGNPTPEVLAGVAGLGDGLTPYDTRVFGSLSNKTVGSLNLTNGQQLPAGAPRLASALLAVSPPHWTTSQDPTLTLAPLCTVNLGLGAPNLGVPLPISAATSPGDTISIRLMSKQLGTFTAIAAATDYAVGANVTKNGVTLAPQGLSSASLGQSISFHVAVP